MKDFHLVQREVPLSDTVRQCVLEIIRTSVTCEFPIQAAVVEAIVAIAVIQLHAKIVRKE